LVEYHERTIMTALQCCWWAGEGVFESSRHPRIYTSGRRMSDQSCRESGSNCPLKKEIFIIYFTSRSFSRVFL